MRTIRSSQPTLADIQRLAAQLGVTFTVNRDSFDLAKSAPIAIHGTYRDNQAGCNAAWSVLVHLQKGERCLLASQQESERHIAQFRRRIRRRGRGILRALWLSYLAALATYIIGTLAPQSRAITGPLTVLCMVLMAMSGCVLLLSRTRN